MKKYSISIPEEAEMFDTLQRYMLDRDARLAVIDRLFESHKMDPDTTLFDSVPYKSYMKEFEICNAKYTEAMNKFSEYITPIIDEKEGKDVIFTWAINNFSDRICEITIVDQ